MTQERVMNIIETVMNVKRRRGDYVVALDDEGLIGLFDRNGNLYCVVQWDGKHIRPARLGGRKEQDNEIL